MNARTPAARLLRLVPKPTGAIDADLVAFTVMEFIDSTYPAMWLAAPRAARVNVRNTIVRAVRAEETKR